MDRWLDVGSDSLTETCDFLDEAGLVTDPLHGHRYVRGLVGVNSNYYQSSLSICERVDNVFELVLIAISRGELHFIVESGSLRPFG